MPNALTSLLPAGIGNALRQYLGDAFGGSLNAEVKPQDTLDAAALSLTPVPVVGDVAGLLADGYRYATDPSSRTPMNYGLSALGALPFVPAMGAVTAWHGSPHKFDKFSLDKIGTGEGAQAYGHGLYLAESPAVATEYKRALSGVKLNDGSVVNPDWTDPAYYAVQALAKSGGDVAKARSDVVAWSKKSNWPEVVDSFDVLVKKGANLDATGQLYKTDIPDEAVARFLDWDKPLSEQAPEVQAVLGKYRDTDKSKIINLIRSGEQPDGFGVVKSGKGYAPIVNGEVVGNGPKDLVFGSHDEALNYIAKQIPATDPTAAAIYRRMVGEHGGADGISQAQVSNLLYQQGIPGIRYLDGGSRSAGQGSSNFVVFSPDMIRILERNGQPTGLQPWAPGEWQGLLGNSVNKESPIRLISSQRFLDQDIVNDKIRKKDFSVKVSPVFELPDTGEKVRVVQDGHHALSAALESGNKPNILEQSVTQNDRIGLLNQGQIDDFLNASYHDSPWYYLDNGIDIW